MVRRSVEVLVDHQPAVTLLLRVHGNSRDRAAPRCAGAAGSTPGWPSWSAAAVDEGALRADLDPDLVSRLLFGMVNSLVEWYRPGRPRRRRRSWPTPITAIAFDGLAHA